MFKFCFLNFVACVWAFLLLNNPAFGVNASDSIYSYEQGINSLDKYRNKAFQLYAEQRYDALKPLLDKELSLQFKNQNEINYVFYKHELHLLSITSGYYDKITLHAKGLDNGGFISEQPNNQQMLIPIDDDYFTKLCFQAYEVRDETLYKINSNSQIGDEDRSFLKLYFLYLLAQDEIDKEIKADIVKLSEEFLTAFPESDYIPHIHNHILLNYKASKMGIGFRFSTGYSLTQGELGNYFSNYAPIGAMIDLAYGRLQFSVGFNGSLGAKTEQAFNFNNENWNNNMQTSVVNIDGYLSFAVLNTPTIKINPFIGAGIFGYKSYIAEDTLRSPEITHFPAYSGGLSIDYKFKYYTNYSSYNASFISEIDNTYWNLNFMLGYLNPMLELEDERFKGYQIFVKIGLGMFFNPARLVKHQGK